MSQRASLRAVGGSPQSHVVSEAHPVFVFLAQAWLSSNGPSAFYTKGTGGVGDRGTAICHRPEWPTLHTGFPLADVPRVSPEEQTSPPEANPAQAGRRCFLRSAFLWTLAGDAAPTQLGKLNFYSAVLWWRNLISNEI